MLMTRPGVYYVGSQQFSVHGGNTMPRRVKASVRSIKLRKWFPPDDPIAAAVARLFLLREDFHLECLAMAAEEVKLLDGNGPLWRHMYFLRQIMKTMMEARSA